MSKANSEPGQTDVDVESVVENTHVFVARFDDGRMKDRLNFTIAETKKQATLMLPIEWRKGSVTVDTLGTLPKFYNLAPKLNYDFKQDFDYPDLLVRAVGEPNLDQIVEVAGTSKGWDALPPRHVLSAETANVAETIEEEYGTSDPVEDEERTHLTDKLVLFRERVRRMVRNDAVEYDDILENPMKKYGLMEEDRPVVEAFHAIEEKRQSVDGVVYCGLILTSEGIPNVDPDIWVEDEDTTGSDHGFEDFQQYDIVLRASSEIRLRRVHHRALNTLYRWISRSEEVDTRISAAHHWYMVEMPSSTSEDYQLHYARSKTHAVRKANCHLEADNPDVNCLGRIDALDIGNLVSESAGVRLGFDVPRDHLPESLPVDADSDLLV